jgi:hypothetical protein
MEQQKLVIGSIIAIIGLFGISYSINDGSLKQLIYFAAFALVIFLIGMQLKQSKTKNILQRIQGRNGNTGTATFQDCKEIAEDFAKEEYGDEPGKSIDFDWSTAKSDMDWVYDLREQEFIVARYFYTQYGPHDTGTYIFVDATNGEFMTSKPAGKQSQREDPFSALDAYDKKLKRRMAAIQARGENSDNGLKGLNIDMGLNGESEDE